jgi:Cellulose binding domain
VRRLRFACPPRSPLRTLAAAVALAAAALAPIGATPASAATSADVSVDAGRALASIPSSAFGMNVAVYDGYMNDSPVAGLLKGAGIGAVRYPGGSYADIYHWKTNTADGGYVAPNTDFDSYMSTVRSAGAQPIIIANYGSGTPQEAADWVRYANVTKGYGAKYWEIGNEVYGNGEYGSGWENDTHSSKSATTYAQNLVQYVTAMKAADPTIKIGAVLTTPGSWPDGITGPGDGADWNHTVMSIAGSKIDFVVVHWYPGGDSPADLLTKPQAQIGTITATLRSLIDQYAGANAANVGIAVTETNSTIDKDTHPAALFAPDDYLTWLENGAFNIDWWNLHNGSNGTTTVNGATDYNDEGVLSNASGSEPAAETPFAPYYGIQLMTRLGAPGDTLVRASSTQPLLTVHAVERSNGDVDLLFINKDPSNAYTANLSYSGFTPSSATPTVYTYAQNATSITSTTTGSATSQTIPAYSLVVVQLHPGGGGGGGGGTCRVSYTKNEWPGGLTAGITVTNTGTSAVNGWTLAFAFPGDTKVTSAWNATVTQTGAAVTAKNVSYNGTIAPGADVSFGFKGTWTSGDPAPAFFTLNGTTCTTG